MSLLKGAPFRLPRLKPYVPDPGDPPIFWFNGEREDVIRDVTRRAVEKHGIDRAHFEYVLNELAYNEVRRLETQRGDEAREQLPFWRGLVRRIARMSDEEKRATLRTLAERMARDVAGNFDPRVYRIAIRMVPRVLSGVMSPRSLPMQAIAPNVGKLDELVRCEGTTEKLRKLAKIGTLVFVPTHVSNLDSVVLGYVLEREGLPPVVYGAGKNLFSNPVMSFFMHNLGAYRVDRRIKATLYKDVLKSYAGVMVERGYHSLFFPGGTRSRSGLIERHLKLGLAGSAVEAFARNQVRGQKRPILFVPTTINYALVLEAETLVEDWLKEAGKARYIIEDDESTRYERWLDFLRRISGMEGACTIRFGEPLDPFGNEVDDDGRSLTPHGKPIDPATYVSRGGKPIVDTARDVAYTTALGEKLPERYLRETVLMSTQLVAHVLFRKLVRATPSIDLFGRIRHRGDVAMLREDLVRSVGEARDRLLALESDGVLRVSRILRAEPPDRIVERALDVWNGYHAKTAAKESALEITIEEPELLLYYQNRLVPFATRIASEADASAAREIARIGGS